MCYHFSINGHEPIQLERKTRLIARKTFCWYWIFWNWFGYFSKPFFFSKPNLILFYTNFFETNTETFLIYTFFSQFFFLLFLLKSIKIHFILDNFKIGTFYVVPGQVMSNVQPSVFVPCLQEWPRPATSFLLNECSIIWSHLSSVPAFLSNVHCEKSDFHCTLYSQQEEREGMHNSCKSA